MASTILPYNNKVILDLVDDFESLMTDETKEAVKKAREVPDATFEDDPVALSITSYLIWRNQPHRRWVPVNEVGRVTPDARAMAHELRKYYLHRGTMKVLQGHTPTEFQYKMNAFLSDIRPLKVDELGMLYRLPYFYQEDLALDQVFEGAQEIDLNGLGATTWMTLTTHTQLIPIREVLKSRKSGDYVQFWFQTTDGHRAVYDVRADNKLITIFRSLFRRDSIQVKGSARVDVLRGSHIRTNFWRLTNLEIE
jgi:hypothetical protein